MVPRVVMGPRTGSAKAFVETVMHGGGDDDESRVLGMVRDRQAVATRATRADQCRAAAGCQWVSRRTRDEESVHGQAIGLKRQATARRDHSTVRTHQADIIRVRGEIES